jgi:hypothetical protein
MKTGRIALLALGFAGVLGAGILAPAASLASVRTFPEARPAGETGSRLQLAGRKTGAEGKVPERGSSAILYGGSSADRYGSSSADRTGVAGQRDSRVYRKPAKHEDDVVKKPRKADEGEDQDDDENQDDQKEK